MPRTADDPGWAAAPGAEGSLVIGLVCSLIAAVSYGAATILQAIGVARMSALPAGTALTVRLRAGWLYGVGLALDGVGFLAALIALRSLPLFLVEAAIASSVAITAVLGVIVLGLTLSRTEVASIVAVAIGLALLAVSADPGPAREVGGRAGWLLLAATALVALIGVAGLAVRRHTPAAVLLSLASGLGFGFVGVAARLIEVDSPWWHTAASPMLWALVLNGVLSVVAYGYALSRGRVTSVAAIVFATETIIPAAIGLIWLGDEVRRHFVPLAAAGFVITLGACISLAGRAEVSGDDGPGGDPQFG